MADTFKKIDPPQRSTVINENKQALNTNIKATTYSATTTKNLPQPQAPKDSLSQPYTSQLPTQTSQPQPHTSHAQPKIPKANIKSKNISLRVKLPPQTSP